MSIRPCIERGCPEYTPRTRCPAHERARDARRGSTAQRGYGAAHQHERAKLRALLPDWCGGGCGAWLTPDGPWVAAHNLDGHPEYGYHPSCLSCNQRTRTHKQ